MASGFVKGFRPSDLGLHFENAFEDGAPVFTIPLPLIGAIPVGNAGGGLCGGMVFTALDFFHNGLLPPADTTVPKPGSPLFDYIAHRLLHSFNGVAGVHKYLKWMRMPDEAEILGKNKSISWHTVNDEWPAIKADLDNDQPCPLGLILTKSFNPFDVGKNHQVLAYGYALDEATGSLQVFVYDPNWPGVNNVTLSVSMASDARPSRITYAADLAGRGFFRTKYTPRDPSGALVASEGAGTG